MASTSHGRTRNGSGGGWEVLFRLVFERSATPIILLDDRRCIVDANAAALALVGRDRGETIGSSVVDSIRPSERDEAAREWKEFLHSGRYDGRRDLVRADGSEVPVSFAARLASIDGRRLAVYVVVEGAGADLRAATAELPLTPREREIVTLIALGHDTDEIAAELHISPATVRTHVRNSMARLEVHSRAQLVATVLCSEHLVDMPRLGRSA
jgi:PAS domain S-box-containing protein